MFNNIILSVMAWKTSLVGYFFTKLKEERGQDLVEYAVIIGAIAMVASIALFAFDFEDIITTFAEEIEACLTFSDECGEN